MLGVGGESQLGVRSMAPTVSQRWPLITVAGNNSDTDNSTLVAAQLAAVFAGQWSKQNRGI